MFAWFGFFLLLFGGAAFVSHVAAKSGRNGALWALLSLVASGVLFLGASALLIQQLDDGMGLSLGYSLLLIIAPICGHVMVGTVATRLPILTHKSSWRMTWLGSTEREAKTTCRVFVSGDALVVEPEPGAITPPMKIPFSSILNAEGDGEAVRISWSNGDVGEQELFKAVDAPKHREAALQHSQTIASRISSHMKTSPRPPKAIVKRL